MTGSLSSSAVHLDVWAEPRPGLPLVAGVSKRADALRVSGSKSLSARRLRTAARAIGLPLARNERREAVRISVIAITPIGAS
jgi:hypothetical protein